MKKTLLAALSVIVIGLAGLILATMQKPQPLSPSMALPDGTSVRILAVTYGTNHVMGSKMERMAARLPLALVDLLNDVPGIHITLAQTITTPAPELLVWLDNRPSGTGAPPNIYCTASLGDGSNFISGPNPGLAGYLAMPLIYPVHFEAFPRRDRKIAFNVFQNNSDGGNRFCGALSFANPLDQSYPQWLAESLPATRRAGDLEVALQGVKIMANPASGRTETEVRLKFHALTNTGETWAVAGAEVADATGNVLRNSGSSQTGGKTTKFQFTPSLWPGEAALKLKLWVKKTEGFQPGETFEFKNVPLGELDRTNVVALVTNLNGVTVTLRSICRRAPVTGSTWNSTQFSNVHVSLSGLAAGAELDLLGMVCDGGKTNRADSWSSSGDERDYAFREIPLDARTASLTFTLQQSRMVEFTVKPEVAPAGNSRK